ncbi:FERM domain-containing protein 5-like isoform X2 [Glandiceps talaboti]
MSTMLTKLGTLTRRKKPFQLLDEQKCMIGLLDESDPMECSYEKETKGQFLLDHVCNTLNILERDYFGLRFVDGEKQRHWLDPAKYVHRQVRGQAGQNLVFRVKFYPADPTRLKEELTRYQMYLQLKRDLLHDRLMCSKEEIAELGAYILQAVLGNYDRMFHLPGYASEFAIAPNQTEKLENRMEELHQTMARGISASQAEDIFLKKAIVLETYGVDPHPVKDIYGTQLFIGLTYQGISLFENRKRVQLFKWIDINKVSYDGKTFFVHAMFNHRKVTHGYRSSSTSASKHLWKCAIEHESFFKFKRSSEITRQKSGGRFFKVKKFRYSGRTEREALAESERIIREAPEFRRSPPKLQPRRSSSFKDKIYRDSGQSSRPAANADDVTPVYNETFDLAHDEPGMEFSRDASFGPSTLGIGSGNGEETPTIFDPDEEIPKPEFEVTEDTKQTIQLKKVQKSSKFKVGIKLLFYLLILLFLFAVALVIAVMETDIEHEYLDELRRIPEVRQVREMYYVPCKTQMARQWNLVVHRCYLPTKKWFIHSWHVFMTKYFNVFKDDYVNVFIDDYYHPYMNHLIQDYMHPSKDWVIDKSIMAFEYIKAKDVNLFKRQC